MRCVVANKARSKHDSTILRSNHRAAGRDITRTTRLGSAAGGASHARRQRASYRARRARTSRGRNTMGPDGRLLLRARHRACQPRRRSRAHAGARVRQPLRAGANEHGDLGDQDAGRHRADRRGLPGSGRFGRASGPAQARARSGRRETRATRTRPLGPLRRRFLFPAARRARRSVGRGLGLDRESAARSSAAKPTRHCAVGNVGITGRKRPGARHRSAAAETRSRRE